MVAPHSRRMRLLWSLAVATFAGCETPPAAAPVASAPSPAARAAAPAPRVLRPAAERDPTVARAARAQELRAPTLSSALHGGRCASQADCEPGNVCVAVTAGVSECSPARFGVGPVPRGAPNGRPAPPLGLLDGKVLRDQVHRGAP